MRPCEHRHPPQPDKCKTCRLYFVSSRYREYFDSGGWKRRQIRNAKANHARGTGVGVGSGRDISPCKHRSLEVLEVRDCRGCNKTVKRVEVYSCTLHNKGCTASQTFSDLITCKHCDDYKGTSDADQRELPVS